MKHLETEIEEYMDRKVNFFRNNTLNALVIEGNNTGHDLDLTMQFFKAKNS